jgi:hypothetical protein|tara:strand:+ start:1715 stop:2098 length:384 start_codon:yes stop_codon:yes gene_type:complete
MAHHGKEGVVKAGSTVIGAVTGFTIDTTADVVEDTSLGNSAKTYLAGRTAFSGSIDMHYDEGDTAQETLDSGATIAFTLLPEGNASGDQSFVGNGIVTSMSVGVSLDGVSTRTVAFQGTGALTIGTV